MKGVFGDCQFTCFPVCQSALPHDPAKNQFLARQANRDEKQWALDFSRSVFNLMQRSPSSYAAVTQTVAAQATLSRFTVVSLLS